MPRYYLIVNPESGSKKGQQIFERIKVIFEAAKIDIEAGITQHKNHPYEMARTIELDGIDAICAIGGDGTFHEVINGMLDRDDGKRVAIGFIPGGTGNSLMHDFDCLDPMQAAHNIVANRKAKMDIMELNANGQRIYSFNIVGWGMPSSINLLAEKMRWVGGQRYNLASVYEVMRNPSIKVQFIIDGQKIEGAYSLFLASNTMFTGNGMKMMPQARIDDGYIDIILAKKTKRLKLLSLFARVFNGTHIGDPTLEIHRAKEFSILTANNDPLNIDGQNVGFSPLHGSVMENQIEIFR